MISIKIPITFVVVYEHDFNPGSVIKVEKAKFGLEGDDNPKLKPKKLS